MNFPARRSRKAVAVLWIVCAIAILSRPGVLAKEVVLEDESLRIAFDAQSGALARLEAKSTGWTIERRPELGLSFRLHAPLPGRRDNFVLGRNQSDVHIEKPSAQQIRLEWKNLVSQHGGVLPLTFTATVTLTNGSLSFQGALVNDSPLMVETIDFPCFGDFTPPPQRSAMAVRSMWYGNLGSDEIYPRFRNDKGYWGVNVPTKTFDSSRSLFYLIESGNDGLYVEMSDPSQPYLLQFTFEQYPGLLSPINNLVPATEEISGHGVRLEFRACHFIFAHPQSTVSLAPVRLQAYEGDWHAGVDLYKQWRASWFKPPHLPEWSKGVHSWAMLRMNTPEEDYTVRYTNLVQFGEEYARNGVSAVQVVGWNHGGQDRDDPVQDTDPGLGTWQEFHNAIQQVQARGVKVILFGKLGWADRTTAWYTNELYKYEATDPYGIPYEQGGYSYVTPTQLAGINNRRRSVMDFLCPAYRDIAANEFRKILALGAAGWLFDENCHHGPARYSFAADHGYRPPGYLFAGDLPLAAQLRAEADKVNRDYLFAGEGHQDWLMQYYPVSSTGIQGVPICQYIDSRLPLLAAVWGFDDRETLNLALLHRYLIMYEPYYYKGHLGDFPLTLAYGRKIDALRQRYHEYLWDGDFRDTLGAKVTANGAVKHSVFVTAPGKRAVVVVNQEYGKAIEAKVDLPNPAKLLVATPEQPDARPTTETLHIPGRSLAVVMEQ